MITPEHASQINCVVAALTAIERRSPNAILADIVAIAADTEVVIDIHGFIRRDVYERYLTGRGWTFVVKENLTSIPLTCLVRIKEHMFALIDGVTWDNGAGLRWPRPIEGIWIPGVGEST